MRVHQNNLLLGKVYDLNDQKSRIIKITDNLQKTNKLEQSIFQQKDKNENNEVNYIKKVDSLKTSICLDKEDDVDCKV